MPRDTVPADGSLASGPLEKDEAFLADYYEHVAAEDLHDYSVATLGLRAREHLELARVRPPGTSRVAVVNERDAGLVLVVTDDLPHALRSVTAELTHEGAPLRLLVHPTFAVRRDPATHELLEVRHGPLRSGLGAAAGGPETGAATGSAAAGAGSAAAAATEIWIAAETSRQADEPSGHRLEARLRRVLADVRDVAADEGALHARMAATVKNVSAFPDGCIPPAAELAELLRWLEGGNFLVLGACDYERTTAAGREILARRPGSGLGLLRHHRLPDSATPAPRSERVLTFVTSGLRSSVERNAYLEEVRLSTFNAAGIATGERCFVGLLAPGAAGPSLRRIPVIRDEVAAVQAQLGIPTASPEGTELAAALESLPLSELFHIETGELTRLAGEMVRLQERRQTRLFLRQDPRGHFVTALFFLPRHRYTTDVGLRIERELKQALRATSLEFDVRVSQPMARVSCRVLLPPGASLEALDATELERRLLQATRTWTEGLSDAIRSRWPSRAARLSALWSGAFPASYQAEVSVDEALEDIRQFERFDLDGAGGRPVSDPLLTVSAVPGAGAAAAPREARVRLYLTSPWTLTQILPLFHNLGLEVLNERPFDLVRGTARPLFLYELDVRYRAGVDPIATSPLLSQAFSAAMRGDSESDRFDALILRERVDWRQVAILRAYAKYLLQLGTTNSYDFIADAVLSNSAATRALLGLFHARFDPGLPAAHRLGGTAAARAAAIVAIDAVESLDADRLLRTFLNLIEATTRTNFYRGRTYLSFKLQPSHLRIAPQPRPRFEIWVYSPRVEGVHLRFGPVARGGLRWSDRREDFRTEVLGLAKAQIVKNSVIVPTGAKGGFFPKRLPGPDADRAAWLAEGIEAYRDFLRGLLDVTDNLAPPDALTAPEVRSPGSVGRVVPPPDVVRHDDDDYYLVVAADKGTAAFSDIANEVAEEYAFWLGDAFASGGSAGYDHKQLGITARGAWESVKEHFRDLGIDCQREDFTVAGIGDMGGDVFGNGMLLSEHIRLVAAFDHRHIFLDPSPDPGSSLAERRRLFELPRSSWADYSPALLSPGGGVYPRTAKSIPMTPHVRRALDLPPTTTALTPPELIQAILRAPVDLMYNGGIGTYVKASTESNRDVGDKANDSVRVNADQLRARIVVEGGNLGMTQRGRVEAALNGVLLNTDAIDNSAGVDCSDHEVNIKIFIDRMIAAGNMAAGERADFLHSLSDDVARLVFKNNRDQNILLRNERALVLNWSPGFERTLDWLEKASELDRTLEALPTTAELHARLKEGKGLTAPELAVLAAYAKIELAKELSESDVADDPWFDRILSRYFPPPVIERFGREIQEHPLRRQIISTVLANDMTNLGGITFAFRTIEETTATAAAVARGFVATCEAYDLQGFVERIAQLPPEFPSEHAAELAVHMRRVIDRATRWYVTHDHRDQPLDRALGRILPTLELLRTSTADYLRGEDADRVHGRLAHWDSVGLPRDLGRRAADMLESFGLLDISLISEQVDEPIERIADLYWAVFHRIGAARILLRITDLPRQSRWEALARAALRDDVYSVVGDITVAVLQTTGLNRAERGELLFADPIERIVEWERGHHEQLARIKDTLAEVTKPGDVDIASLSVVLKLLRTLLRT